MLFMVRRIGGGSDGPGPASKDPTGQGGRGEMSGSFRLISRIGRPRSREALGPRISKDAPSLVPHSSVESFDGGVSCGFSLRSGTFFLDPPCRGGLDDRETPEGRPSVRVSEGNTPLITIWHEGGSKHPTPEGL